MSASFGEIMACLVRVPTEIIKQRAQVNQNEGKRKTWTIAKSIYKNNNLKGFYRGYTTTVIREIPFSFIELPLWEYLKRLKQKNKVFLTLFCLNIILVWCKENVRF